jgi:hypothetical protein
MIVLYVQDGAFRVDLDDCPQAVAYKVFEQVYDALGEVEDCDALTITIVANGVPVYEPVEVDDEEG